MNSTCISAGAKQSKNSVASFAAPDQEVGVITERITDLQQASIGAHEDLSNLTNRLERGLRPCCPQPASNDKQAPGPMESQTATALAEIHSTICHLRARIQEIQSRVEL